MVLASAAVGAQSRLIGFNLQISIAGVFSPKVLKAVVGEVLPDSQAKAAGLLAGDELIQVDGLEVPGNAARVLEPHLEFVPGTSKRLVLKRADGSTYEVTLTKTTQ